MIYFLRQNQQFYNDDIRVVYDRLCAAREEFNTGRPNPIPFVNWIPEYGGPLFDAKKVHKAEEKYWEKCEASLPVQYSFEFLSDEE